MKKILFLIAFITCGLMAQAQLMNLSVSAADDTLTNTQTGNLTITIGRPVDVLTFELTVERVSGTAAATAKLQGSLDGTIWHDVGSSYTVTNLATQSASFSVSPSHFIYYRVNVAASGTMILVPTGKVLIRRL